MIRRLLFALMLVCLGGAAQATTCALPYNFTNGQLADANQVMANFNALSACVGAPNVSGFPSILSISGVKCDGFTDDAPAINAGIVASPAIYQIPAGKTCAIGSTLGFTMSSTGLVCLNGGAPLNLGGNAIEACATLRWIGPAGGVMISVAPPASPSANLISGVLFEGLSLICDGSINKASTGLIALNVANSTFSKMYAQRCTTSGYVFGPQEPSAQTPRFQSNLLSRLQYLDDVGSGNGMTTLTTPNGDFSLNLVEDFKANIFNGVGFELDGSDSNTFINIFSSRNFYLGGAGTGIVLGSTADRGNNSNIFISAAGGVQITGSNDGIVVGGVGGTDGICSGANYTSSTGAFTPYDVGKGITGTNIPNGTTISSRQNASNITLSQACTSGGSGLTYTVSGRFASVNSWFMGLSSNSETPPRGGTGASFRTDLPTGHKTVNSGSTYTILPQESGVIFDNAGATVDQPFLLPQIFQNAKYCFVNSNGSGVDTTSGAAISLTSRAGANIKIAGSPTIYPFQAGIISRDNGASICFEANSINGTMQWVATKVVGNWLGPKTINVANTPLYTITAQSGTTITTDGNSVFEDIILPVLSVPHCANASISGSVLTIPLICYNGPSIQNFTIGPTDNIQGSGIPAGTFITSNGTGTGGAGTYNLNVALTVPAEEIAVTPPAPWPVDGEDDQVYCLVASNSNATIRLRQNRSYENMYFNGASVSGAFVSAPGGSTCMKAAIVNGSYSWVSLSFSGQWTTINPSGQTVPIGFAQAAAPPPASGSGVSNQQFTVVPLAGWPLSQSCTPGQAEIDIKYLYVCTSPNTWKRTGLSAL